MILPQIPPKAISHSKNPPAKAKGFFDFNTSCRTAICSVLSWRRIIYGREQTTKDFAIRMLNANKSYDEISEFTVLTVEQINDLAASLQLIH